VFTTLLHSPYHYRAMIEAFHGLPMNKKQKKNKEKINISIE
jgi:hypothetical protein